MRYQVCGVRIKGDPEVQWDKRDCNDIRRAKLERDNLVATYAFVLVFIRQYYTDRYGRAAFRVLHRYTFVDGRDLVPKS